MRVRLIGVDYSSDLKKKKVGLARADYTKGDKKIVIDSAKYDKPQKIEKKVIEWISGAEKVLLAIDAPLGWPKPLGKSLVAHKAGRALSERDANCLFMRKTDLWIKENYKNPLSVGADKIARTAHAALLLLDSLRNKTERKIPLAWDLSCVAVAGISVIEVYPTATLIAHGFRYKGLKDEEGKDNRAEVVKCLKSKMTFCGNVKDKMIESDDVFDAVLCVLAAADFVNGDATPPSAMDSALVKKEGWIWAKQLP